MTPTGASAPAPMSIARWPLQLQAQQQGTAASEGWAGAGSSRWGNQSRCPAVATPPPHQQQQQQQQPATALIQAVPPSGGSRWAQFVLEQRRQKHQQHQRGGQGPTHVPALAPPPPPPPPALPGKPQAQRQGPRGTGTVVRQGAYGAGTAFEFQPGPPAPTKPKAQATLQEVMAWHRAAAAARPRQQREGQQQGPQAGGKRQEWARELLEDAADWLEELDSDWGDDGGLGAFDTRPPASAAGPPLAPVPAPAPLHAPGPQSALAPSALGGGWSPLDSAGGGSTGQHALGVPPMPSPSGQAGLPAANWAVQSASAAGQQRKRARHAGGSAGTVALPGGGTHLAHADERAARRGRAQLVLAAEPAAAAGGGAAAGGRRQHQQQRWPWLQHRCDAQGRGPGDPAFDPRTITIPATAWANELQGVWGQYWRIKQRRMDEILFFQEGNFYHLYDADAEIGMRLGLQVCVGVTLAAFPQWAAKVLALGWKVGRVDEDPRGRTGGRGGVPWWGEGCAQAYTPGCLVDGAMAEACGGGQPLVALLEGECLRFAAAVVDVQAAVIQVSQWQEVEPQRGLLSTLLAQANPSEVAVLPGGAAPETLRLLHRHAVACADGSQRALLVNQLGPSGQEGGFALAGDPCDPGAAGDVLRATDERGGPAPAPSSGRLQACACAPPSLKAAYSAQGGSEAAWEEAAPYLAAHPLAAAALGMAVACLTATRAAPQVLPYVRLESISTFSDPLASGHMLLDGTAIRSLEVLANSEGGARGSLLAALDGTASPAGRRLLRCLLCAPLYR
eukprot:scaffold12.g8065.t1